MSAASYREFLRQKSITAAAVGIADPGPLSPHLKPFQADITRWALRRGRAGLFEGTGLGKTLQQLVWADEVERHTGSQVLLHAPLAVAEQTVEEARKFGIEGVAYAENGKQATCRLPITNYDRADRFDHRHYGGVVADESGILKSHESQTRIFLTEACRDTPFILAATAVPAPNDYIELGNHAEFLGVMRQQEMLATFFVHEGAIRADANTPEWRLKRHAEKDFWRWLASWSVVIRHPRDLGYDESGYDLPALHTHQVTIATDDDQPEGMLLSSEARTLSERLTARRDTIEARARAAADIILREPHEPWLIWCGLNAEADAIRKLVPPTIEVAGPDDRDVKAERLAGFAAGRYDRLVSKPSICGWGLNFQRCARMVFVGLNDSFEQLFQAIRRCWRFGQLREVHVYLVASDREGAVVKNLAAKEADYDAMCAAMAEHMADLNRQNIRGGRVATDMHIPSKIMEIPPWLIH